MRSFFLKAILLLLFLLLATYAGLEVAGRRSEARLEIRFSNLMEGQSVEGRFPPTEDNASVVRLRDLGREIGISMETQSTSIETQPPEAARERWTTAKPLIRDHQLAIRKSTEEALPPFPAELHSFFEANQSQLEALRQLLIHAPPPVWKTNVLEGFAMEIPDYLGLLSLQRLLLSEANLRLVEDEDDAFLANLEASWRLNEAMADSPTLIAQLVALAVFRDQVPLLLRMRDIPPIWRDRIAAYDAMKGIQTGLRMESWVAFRSARADQLEGLTEQDLPFFADAYIRWGLFQHAELMLDFVERLPTHDLEGFDPQLFFDEHFEAIPRWNVIGRMLVPNLYDAWTKAAYDELTRELVLAVWSLREGETDLADPNWKVEVSNDETSIERVEPPPTTNEKAVRLEFRWPTAVDEEAEPRDSSP